MHSWFELIVELIVIGSLLIIAITDWRFRRVPEACTLPCLILALYYAFISHHLSYQVLGAALIGGWLLGMRLLGRLMTGKQTLGFGDVTLGAVIGMVCGPIGGLLAIVLGMLGGLPTELLRTRLQPAIKTVPMATYMALGAIVVILAAPSLTSTLSTLNPLLIPFT